MGSEMCIRDRIWVEAKIEAKIEARPTLGPGQANGARPGFIVCLSMWNVLERVAVSICPTKVMFKDGH